MPPLELGLAFSAEPLASRPELDERGPRGAMVGISGTRSGRRSRWMRCSRCDDRRVAYIVRLAGRIKRSGEALEVLGRTFFLGGFFVVVSL